MRTPELILDELEVQGKIIHPHTILDPPNERDEVRVMRWLFHRIAQQGEVNGIFGRSGIGKTWLASTLISLYASMGYKVYHNLPIENKSHPLIIRETLLSELTKSMCDEPIDGTGMPIIIFIDEATLRASGSLGGMSKKLFSFKTWVTAFMRKLGGGGGASLFIVFQHNSQMAPMFRGDFGQQNGLLLCEMHKVSHTAMVLDFPNDKGKPGFDIQEKDIPFFVHTIPKPFIKTHSFGASSFEVDFDILKMDEWIARNTRDDPSPKHFREVIHTFFEMHGDAQMEGAKGGSAKGRLDAIKNLPELNTTDRLALLEKIFSREYVEKEILKNQADVAREWGVSGAAISKGKGKLGWMKE